LNSTDYLQFWVYADTANLTVAVQVHIESIQYDSPEYNIIPPIDVWSLYTVSFQYDLGMGATNYTNATNFWLMSNSNNVGGLWFDVIEIYPPQCLPPTIPPTQSPTHPPTLPPTLSPTSISLCGGCICPLPAPGFSCQQGNWVIENQVPSTIIIGNQGIILAGNFTFPPEVSLQINSTNMQPINITGCVRLNGTLMITLSEDKSVGDEVILFVFDCAPSGNFSSIVIKTPHHCFTGQANELGNTLAILFVGATNTCSGNIFLPTIIYLATCLFSLLNT